MGTASLSTPYTIHQLARAGVKPDDVRKALGFSPSFMAKLFKVALDAEPALKDQEGEFGTKTPLYHFAMSRMVAKSVIPRLCQGWVPWAQQQAAEWEAMPDGEAEAIKEAKQIEQHLASA